MIRERSPCRFELLEWGLIRVRLGRNVSVHAVGLRLNHPHEETRIVVTSQVQWMSDSRRALKTRNGFYDLDREIAQFPDDHFKHHAKLIALKGVQPDRIDWLRPDGTVYHSMESATLAEISKA